MNDKKFAGQVTALILLNLLVKFIWIFFIERKVQLTVGFEEFGLYYSIFNFTLILSVINDPGLNNYLIQNISGGKTDATQVSNLFYLKTILAGLYVIVSLGVSLVLGFSDYQILVLLLLYQILYSFLNYCRGFLKGHQLLKAEIYFSVLEKSILVISLIPVLYFNNGISFTITFFVVGQIIAVSLALVLCVFYLRRMEISLVGCLKISSIFLWKTDCITTPNPRRRGTPISWQAMTAILRKIFPFAVFAFLVLAYNKIDTVMLATMLPNGALETGIYVAAYRFLDAASMLPILFATLFYPVLCKIISDRKKIETLINNSLSTLLALTFIIASASWFSRDILMELFYREKTSDELALIFGLLMFSLPLVVLYYVLSSFFTANNNLRLLNYVSFGGLIVNIFLNFILIPNYQALGAAIGSLVSFSVVGLAYIVLYFGYFKYPFEILLWVKLLFFISLLIVFGYLFDYLTGNPILNFLLYTVVSILSGFFFKFFDVKSIRGIIGSRF